MTTGEDLRRTAEEVLGGRVKWRRNPMGGGELVRVIEVPERALCMTAREQVRWLTKQAALSQALTAEQVVRATSGWASRLSKSAQEVVGKNDLDTLVRDLLALQDPGAS